MPSLSKCCRYSITKPYQIKAKKNQLMHSQLILLHSDMNMLKTHAAKLMPFVHQLTNTHTQVLFVNQTATYADWLFAYLEEFIIEMTVDMEMPLTGSSPLTTSTAQISWFTLASDLDAINPTAKKETINALQRHNIKLIDEFAWVDLVNQADKIITIS